MAIITRQVTISGPAYTLHRLEYEVYLKYSGVFDQMVLGHSVYVKFDGIKDKWRVLHPDEVYKLTLNNCKISLIRPKGV